MSAELPSSNSTTPKKIVLGVIVDEQLDGVPERKSFNPEIAQENVDEELVDKLKMRSRLLAEVESNALGSNLIVCDKCNNFFDSPSNYFNHVIERHRNTSKCSQCSESFKDTICQLAHEEKEHGKINYFCCPHCDSGFEDIDTLESHLHKNHNQLKRFPCPVCEGSFRRINDLKRHLDVHLEIRQYVCQHCGKEFSHQSNLARHERLHTGEKPYVCQICSKRFAQSFSLRTHLWLHSDAVSCEHCCLKFRSISGFTRHYKHTHNIKLSNTQAEALHNSKKNTSFFYCRHCGERFMKKKMLNDHVNNVHKESLETSNCPEITEAITSDGSELQSTTEQITTISLVEAPTGSLVYEPLILKIEEKNPVVYELSSNFFEEISHGSGEVFTLVAQNDVQSGIDGPLVSPELPPVDEKPAKKLYKCDICGKETNKKWNHEIHLGSHDPSLKKHACNLCNQRFSTMRALNRHVLSHTNIDVTPHQCQHCEKSYKTSDSLSYHVRKKHNNRINHQCQICSKGFYGMAEYSYHMRIHSKEKPYMCSSCGKKFAHSSHLHRHEKIHSGIKPHKCQYCDKAFIQSNSLKAHLKVHGKCDPEKSESQSPPFSSS